MYIEKILKNKIKYSVAIFVLYVFFFGYSEAYAATLQINSSTTNLSPGNTTTLYVVLNSEGTAINNAEATINFPADVFEVVSVQKGGSIFSLWVEEPYFSNSSGVVTFNGGLPTPGFNGSQGPVLSIVVKAKKAGQGSFTFSTAAVRANDGLGTDVLNKKLGKSIVIGDKKEPAPQAVVAPVTPVVPVREVVQKTPALQITSSSHVDQNKWYTDASPSFAWKIPTGVDAVQTAMDNTTAGAPRVIYSPAIKQKTMADHEDGVWYFKIRAQKNDQWGPVSTYVARIDTTNPKINSANFMYDDVEKILHIDADIEDVTSGLEYYEIYINDFLLEKVTANKFIDGKYSIEAEIPGENTITLVAVDRAGNSVESTENLISNAATTPSIPEPVVTPVVTDATPAVAPADTSKQLLVSIGTFSMPAIHLTIALLLAMIVLAIGGFALGRYLSPGVRESRVRNGSINDEKSRILSLLKERLERHLEILQHAQQSRMVLSREEKEIKDIIENDLQEVDRAIQELNLG